MKSKQLHLLPAAATLTDGQRAAINGVLVDAGLLTANGDLSTPSSATLSESHQTALQAVAAHDEIEGFLGLPSPGCIAARIAEAAAVTACALVPGGQIAIAICVAAAHEAANAACN